MKKYASSTLRLISLLYCALPVVYPIWLALWFEVPGQRVLSLFLSPIYWFVIVLAAIAGYSIWEMKRWAWYIFLAANLLLVYESAFVVATHGQSDHSAVAFLVAVVCMLFMVIRVGLELRVPYFLPEIRWWESDPAKKLLIPVSIVVEGAPTAIDGEIMDLALSGCFVKSPVDFGEDAKVSLLFSLFGYELECPGFVVWRAASSVTHPKGVGVKFDGLAKIHKRRLRISTRRLRELSVFTPVALKEPIVKGQIERIPQNAKG